MKLSSCPVHRTLEFIGGKRKPIILYYLKSGTIRSRELARRIPEASAKVLTQQLRELERDGILRRKVYATVPPKVEYTLTPLGLTLRPVLQAMADWGMRSATSVSPQGSSPTLQKKPRSNERGLE